MISSSTTKVYTTFILMPRYLILKNPVRLFPYLFPSGFPYPFRLGSYPYIPRHYSNSTLADSFCNSSIENPCSFTNASKEVILSFTLPSASFNNLIFSIFSNSSSTLATFFCVSLYSFTDTNTAIG